MAKTSQAVDGRESMAWIVNDFKDATGTVKAGSFGIITGKAATGSVFAEQKVNQPFYAAKDLTLAEGDSCKILELIFMGFATSKDLNQSKETTDVTMDYDEKTAKVTNGQVTTSGSINGMYVTEDLNSKSATNLIKSRFNSIVQYDAEGTVTVMNADTTNKDIILILSNYRNAKEGDLVDIMVVPVLLTSVAISFAYNSSATFNLSFDGSATDENNYEGLELQVPFSDALKGALPTARPTVVTTED